jgi:hypothetical protein
MADPLSNRQPPEQSRSRFESSERRRRDLDREAERCDLALAQLRDLARATAAARKDREHRRRARFARVKALFGFGARASEERRST